MFNIKFCILIVLISALATLAQTNTQRSPLDPANWGVVLDHPAAKNVTVKRDITYFTSPAGAQTIDIYTPPGAKAGEKLPAVIFLNAIGDRPGDKVKNWGIYSSWPRLIAAHNMIGISMDADGERIQDSLRGLFDFLAKDGAKHGIDADRLGVYAASANVTQSSIYLMGDGASKGIKAAALFYGGVPNLSYRKDLPVLFIVAEGDMAGGIGQGVPGLWQKVIDARAPWTVVFASRMPHAFDAFEDTDESRQHVMQALAFWKTHLQSVPAPSWTPSPARAIVSATYGNDYQKTADLLTKYMAENPNDAQGLILLGRTMGQLQRPDDAAAATSNVPSRLMPRIRVSMQASDSLGSDSAAMRTLFATFKKPFLWGFAAARYTASWLLRRWGLAATKMRSRATRAPSPRAFRRGPIPAVSRISIWPAPMRG